VAPVDTSQVGPIERMACGKCAGQPPGKHRGRPVRSSTRCMVVRVRQRRRGSRTAKTRCCGSHGCERPAAHCTSRATLPGATKARHPEGGECTMSAVVESIAPRPHSPTNGSNGLEAIMRANCLTGGHANGRHVHFGTLSFLLLEFIAGLGVAVSQDAGYVLPRPARGASQSNTLFESTRQQWAHGTLQLRTDRLNQARAGHTEQKCRGLLRPLCLLSELCSPATESVC